MMKNIWDAVNELKGELRNSNFREGEGYLYWCSMIDAVRRVLSLNGDSEGDNDYALICSIEQFNECVSEMSDWLPTGWKLEDYAPEKMMIAVKEVKAILGEGFEFVEGDTIRDSAGLTYKKDWFDQESEFIDYDMTLFAPRNNAGVQPVGDDVWVDVFSKGEIAYRGSAGSFAYWENNTYYDTWKPCIKWLAEQSNIKTEEEIQEMAKPVFTQAMADAGRYEFLPTRHSSNGSWFYFDVIAIKSGVAFGFDHSAGHAVPCHMILNEFDYRTLQTEQDKTIDEMYKILRVHPKTKNAAKALYDAGYRKA